MAFILKVAVTTPALGSVLESLLKNQDVKLLDCELAERSLPPKVAQLHKALTRTQQVEESVKPKAPRAEQGLAYPNLVKIISEAVAVGAEFTPKSILHLALRKMKYGTFYTVIQRLADKGVLSRPHPGIYVRLK